MKVARVVEPGRVEIAEMPRPAPAGAVLIKTVTVGICGTDVKILSGAIPVTYPRVMGHEMIGEVVDAPDAGPFRPGMRVLVDPASACGTCDLCHAGRPNLCRNAGLMGRDLDGVFAEFITAPETRVIPVPDSVSSEAAGMLQVLGTCIHAQRQVEVFPGQVAAVVGLGVSGQLMVQLLRERGVRVAGITRSGWKRDLAARHGAEATASPDDARDLLADLTGGRGPDLVVEAAGTEETLASSIELVGVGGQVLVFGTLTKGEHGLPYYQMYLKELTIHNPRAAVPGDYALGVQLAAEGRLSLEPIITHRLSLDEASEAFELVHDPASLKVLMDVA